MMILLAPHIDAAAAVASGPQVLPNLEDIPDEDLELSLEVLEKYWGNDERWAAAKPEQRREMFDGRFGEALARGAAKKKVRSKSGVEGNRWRFMPVGRDGVERKRWWFKPVGRDGVESKRWGFKPVGRDGVESKRWGLNQRRGFHLGRGGVEANGWGFVSSSISTPLVGMGWKATDGVLASMVLVEWKPRGGGLASLALSTRRILRPPAG
jgi:hypothetical protein